MTDILVLTLTLLIAWGAYTLVGKNSNEKSKGILSLAYIFCIMTAMEYYQGGIAGCIIILSISLALIFLRYLWKSGHKLPWTITLLAEWTFPIVFYNTLDRFSGLSSGICLPNYTCIHPHRIGNYRFYYIQTRKITTFISLNHFFYVFLHRSI